MRLGARVALLVSLWLLAWGQITLANLLSGVLVATALLVAFPLGARTGRRVGVDVVGVARLTAYVLVQLVLSNLVMAKAILRPRTASPGVVEHRLACPSEQVVTFMTTVISLSPGTMTVDVDDTSSCIHVHFFSLDDVGAARAVLARLERLVVGAIPPKEQP